MDDPVCCAGGGNCVLCGGDRPFGGPAPTVVERSVLKVDNVVTIIGESETTSDVVWWPVTVDATGEQGWVDASKLEALTSGPEPTATS